MNLKKWMLSKIEKDSIKVNVEGETVYLKKSGLIKEWRVIYPPIDLVSVDEATDKDGKVDWTKVKYDAMNAIFGGKGNAVKYALIGFFMLLLALGIYEVVNSYNATFSNPIVQACLESANIKLVGG